MPAKTLILAAALALAGSLPSQAGILINPQGIFLTEPEVQAFVRDETGQVRFGSPAGGFRRTGRSGFFPTPVDPGLPRNGRNAFGGAGYEAEPAAPHGPVERTILDRDPFFGLFD